jgi:uncharacterized protein YaiE (UPF0345 family)
LVDLKGQIYIVAEAEKDGWLKVSASGEIGYVPSNYVEVNSNSRPSVTSTDRLEVMKLLCVYDYDGKDKEDLNMKAGDAIEAVPGEQSETASNDAWWRGKNIRTESVGTFPLAFTEGWEVNTRKGKGLARFSTLSLRSSMYGAKSPVGRGSKLGSSKLVSSTESFEEQEIPVGIRVKAVYEFKASNNEEMSLEQGDVLDGVVYVDGDEWMKGRNVRSGEVGEFPAVYTEAYVNGAKVGGYAVALFDFEKAGEDELELREGDIIEAVESVDGEWMRGRVGENEGVFPSSYVEMK